MADVIHVNDGVTPNAKATSVNVPGNGIPAGVTIIVRCIIVGQAVPPSITDSAGNTYQKIDDEPAGGDEYAWFYAWNVKAVSGGGVITASGNGAPSDGAMMSVDYLPNASAAADPLDQHVPNRGNSANPNSGPTPATLQAIEVSVGFIGCAQNAAGGQACSTPNGYAPLTSPPELSSGGYHYDIFGFFGDIAAVGPQDATQGGLSYAGPWAAFTATFRTASAPVPPPPPPVGSYTLSVSGPTAPSVNDSPVYSSTLTPHVAGLIYDWSENGIPIASLGHGEMATIPIGAAGGLVVGCLVHLPDGTTTTASLAVDVLPPYALPNPVIVDSAALSEIELLADIAAAEANPGGYDLNILRSVMVLQGLVFASDVGKRIYLPGGATLQAARAGISIVTMNKAQGQARFTTWTGGVLDGNSLPGVDGLRLEAEYFSAIRDLWISRCTNGIHVIDPISEWTEGERLEHINIDVPEVGVLIEGPVGAANASFQEWRFDQLSINLPSKYGIWLKSGNLACADGSQIFTWIGDRDNVAAYRVDGYISGYLHLSTESQWSGAPPQNLYALYINPSAGSLMDVQILWNAHGIFSPSVGNNPEDPMGIYNPGNVPYKLIKVGGR